jgi:hypothetical protein
VRRMGEIFDLVVSGWDTDPAHPCPGGVFWTQAPWSSDRNTVSNAGSAGRTAPLPGDARSRPVDLVEPDVRLGADQHGGTERCVLGTTWGLAGNIEKTQWSYNQGVMIGAGVLLYRATGRRRYLTEARDTAARPLWSGSRPCSPGTLVTTPGSPESPDRTYAGPRRTCRPGRRR